MTLQEILSAIRAEIERKKKWLNAPFTKEANISAIEVCDLLLSFIDSLPAEEASEDLEEEIAQYFTTKFGFERKDETLEIDKLSINSEDLLHIARHFAEWGKKQTVYPVSQDLEEASTEYAERAYYHPVDRNVGKADFIMGAQWHQQQMMKGAIEADVRVDVPVNDDYVYIRAYIKQEKLKVGDKVKLIIIKED